MHQKKIITMKNTLISVCGLNCETCEARIATITNDDVLRKKTAEQWQKMFNSPEINPSSINCTGCRMDGVKIAHCNDCKIRSCAQNKGHQTCGDCNDLESCELVSMVHKFSPDALTNLKNIHN